MTPGDELRDLPLPERIRHVREKILKLSQAKLADKLGVSERSVKRWEKGTRPDRGTLDRLAVLAKLPADIFGAREEAPTYSRLLAELAEIRGQLAAAEQHRLELGADLRAQLGAEIQQQLAEQTDLLTRLSALAAAMEQSQTKLEADVAELRRLRPKRRPA